MNGTADFVNDYTFDGLNRNTRLTQAAQGSGPGFSAVAEKRVDFAYNAIGQYTAINRYSNLAGTSVVATSNFTYDSLARLTDLTHAQGASTLAAYGWTFDSLNRIASFASPDGTTNYTYDTTSQLTSADHSYQSDENYSYDANGNRTNAGYETGGANRLLSDGTYNYDYDAEGNRTRRTHIATGAVTEYQWDHRNRLTAVTERAAAGGAIAARFEYEYDLFDRRITKRLDADGDGTPETVRHFAHDGAHVALALDEAGAVTSRYLHGPAIDQILADEQVTTPGTAGEVLWPLADHQGTVRDLATFDAATGLTEIANHLVYNSFGQVTSETHAAVDHLFGFTGRERDEETGLYQVRARYLDPTLGRFLSEDPIKDGKNWYVWVSNNSPNATDPSGRAPGGPLSLIGPDPSVFGDQSLSPPAAGGGGAAQQPQGGPLFDALLREIGAAPSPAFGNNENEIPPIVPEDVLLNSRRILAKLAALAFAEIERSMRPPVPGDCSEAFDLGVQAGIFEFGSLATTPFRWAGFDFSERESFLDELWANLLPKSDTSTRGWTQFAGKVSLVSTAAATVVVVWGAVGMPTWGIAWGTNANGTSHILFGVKRAGEAAIEWHHLPAVGTWIVGVDSTAMAGAWTLTGFPILFPGAAVGANGGWYCWTAAIRSFFRGWGLP